MKKSKTELVNEDIIVAKFMGLMPNKLDGGITFGIPPFYLSPSGETLASDWIRVQYRNSWDQIMLVVAKIESLGYVVAIVSGEINIYNLDTYNEETGEVSPVFFHSWGTMMGDLSNMSQTIYLKDNLTGAVVDLASEYIFTSGAGEFNDRFELLYQVNSLSLQNTIKEDFVIWSEAGTIYIQKDSIKSVVVYDLTGRVLYNSTTGEKVIKIEVKNQAVVVIVDGITKKLML